MLHRHHNDHYEEIEKVGPFVGGGLTNRISFETHCTGIQQFRSDREIREREIALY